MGVSVVGAGERGGRERRGEGAGRRGEGGREQKHAREGVGGQYENRRMDEEKN